VPGWAARLGIEAVQGTADLELVRQASCESLRIDFRSADALEFCQLSKNIRTWDLLAAHAFLDLFDLPAVLPVFLHVLRPGGAFYFTLNFDGETIFEPHIDPGLDEHIISLYHRSMDERRVNGLPSGDSRSGRHLFSLLPQAGGMILASGASDWVVFPGPGGYPGDEAYFLHHILHFFEQSLSGHPELDDHRFSDWLERRHAQVERTELVYIAHQMDFFGLMGRG
jgi:SAM-dependent methyltransferase